MSSLTSNLSIVSQLKLSSNIAIANCNLAKKIAKKSIRITFEILLSQVMKDERLSQFSNHGIIWHALTFKVNAIQKKDINFQFPSHIP